MEEKPGTMGTVISVEHQNPISGDGGSRLNEGQRSSGTFRLTQRSQARLFDIIRTRYVRLPSKLKAAHTFACRSSDFPAFWGHLSRRQASHPAQRKRCRFHARSAGEPPASACLAESLHSRHYSRLFTTTYGANFEPMGFSFDQLPLPREPAAAKRGGSTAHRR
jgi:hypothetical protein